MSTDISKKNKWIEVIPHGIAEGMGPGISLIVFKEKEGEERFGICLSKLQSEIAFQQGVRREQIFSFLNPLLKSLDAYPKACYFHTDGNKDPYLEIAFGGEANLKLRFKARESLVFSIYHKCQFFCTSSFIDEMRELKFDASFKKVKKDSPLNLN